MQLVWYWMTFFFTIVICILNTCDIVVAAPYTASLLPREQQNETNVDLKVGWVSSPNTRGTFDILLSSLTTLALCSWTAYHPNIKPRNTLWRSFYIRLMWMVMVVVVPELVLFIAWDQRAAAIQIRNYMNSRIEKERNELDEKSKAENDAALACEKQTSASVVAHTNEQLTNDGMENVDSAINVKGKATSNLTKMTAVTVNTGNGTATDEAQRDLRTSITGVHDGAISENQVSLEHQPSPASINSSLSSTSWERISLCSINMNQLSIPKPNKAGEAGSQSVVGAKAFSEKDSAESTDRKTSWNPFKYFKSLKTFEKKKKPQDKHLWTIEDAFFAAIGGYAVRSDSFWPSTYSETLTFTPLGIIELARLGLLTKADSATVSDKSKADVVAKIIVCIQATWFFFQCIARLIQGLSVTLLEIHVLAHVACTFVMYFFWFHKPYNVEHPIILTDEKVLDFAALFAVAGPEEESHVACGPQRVCRQSPSVIIEQVQYAQYLTSRLNRLKTLYKDMLIDIIMPCSAETEGELSDDEDEHSDEGDEEMTEEEVANQIGNGLVKEAWLRANRALDVYKPMEIVLTAEERENIHVPASQKQQKEGDIEILHILTQPHVVVRKKNHELNPLIELANVPKSRFHKHAKYTFTAMSIMYGAIHLAAWNAFFSSVAEMWIWRALAIEIVSIPPLLLFWHELLQDNSKGLSTRKSFEGIVKGIRLALDVLVMASLFFTLGVGYVFGRLFIFGEVFANLREVLPDTYTTVEWTNFIPHAG